MARTWLILDCHYLAYRAFFAMGRKMEFGDIRTGMLYGFLRDIGTLQDLHATNRMVFCFDHGRSLRQLACPEYKSNRKRPEMDEDEVVAYRQFRRQLKLLRTSFLKDVGFRNVFSSKGYEADDLIASVVHTLPTKDRAIIVSADHDLYQLLSDRVFMYSPAGPRGESKVMTVARLQELYGVTPEQWIKVKAIAGCHSDVVRGIPGIGEKTATKYLAGGFNPECATVKKIKDGKAIWKKNMGLVQLPYPGTPVYRLRKDNVSSEAWEAKLSSLGMRSLKNKVPGKRKEDRRGKGFDLRTGSL